jgi:hypothetical protein
MDDKDERIAALEQQVSELQSLRGELAALKAIVIGMPSSKGFYRHGEVHHPATL